MNILDFNDIKSIESIDSFLKGKQISHKQENIKDASWFDWKFYKNPYTISILPCAFDDKKSRVAGANFYGTIVRKYNSQTLNTILPYEAYVRPEYQGQGLFKALVEDGEQKAKEHCIDIMLAFPNSLSIKGFVKNGWTEVKNPVNYLLKFIPSFNLIKNFKHIKTQFEPEASSEKNNFSFNGFTTSTIKNLVSGFWSKEYLEWRFNTLPQAKYIQVKTDDINMIARIGYRGKLKEVQILFIDDSKSSNIKKDIKHILKQIRKTEKSDLISFPISEHHHLKNVIKKNGFFNVKSNTNFTYKVLNNTIDKELKFSLCGLDFHTY